MITDAELLRARDLPFKSFYHGRIGILGSDDTSGSATITKWEIDPKGWCDSQFLTMPAPGLLILAFHVRFTDGANTTGYRFCSISLNGTRVAGHLTDPATGNESAIGCTYMNRVEAGDSFTMHIQHSAGGVLGLQAGHTFAQWEFFEL